MINTDNPKLRIRFKTAIKSTKQPNIKELFLDQTAILETIKLLFKLCHNLKMIRTTASYQ